MSRTQLSLFQPKEEIRSIKLKEGTINFCMRANYRIKKGRLVVSPEEGLIVEIPAEPTISRARRMIRKKKHWVLDALEGIRKKQQTIYDIKKHENSVLIMGQEKMIKVKLGQSKPFVKETAKQISFGFEQKRISKLQVHQKLTEWLKTRSRNYFALRVRQMNKGRFKYNKVTIKNHKSLWGSCSAQGNLNFNWRLIMAPRFVSDYIFIHELCHTKYLDHSRIYWKLVKSISPRYEKAEKWLQDYGFVLSM